MSFVSNAAALFGIGPRQAGGKKSLKKRTMKAGKKTGKKAGKKTGKKAGKKTGK